MNCMPHSIADTVTGYDLDDEQLIHLELHSNHKFHTCLIHANTVSAIVSSACTGIVIRSSGDNGGRTRNLCAASAVLSQLSYVPKNVQALHGEGLKHTTGVLCCQTLLEHAGLQDA